MKEILAYIIFLTSCVLYFIVPNIYSFEYCLWIHNLFLFTAVLLYTTDLKNEKVGFNLLFTISFFFTNFVYPVYIYPIDPNYSLFNIPFNTNVITKCTALSQIAYSSYVVGYIYKLPKCHKRINLTFTLNPYELRKIEIGICLFVGIFIISGGLEYFEDRYLRGEMSTNMVSQYMMLFFTPVVIWFASLIFFCREKSQSYHIYFILIAIAFILMISGTRTIPLLILVSLFLIYCNQHKASIFFVLSCLIVGIILMSFIGNVRHDGILDSSYAYNENSQFGWIEYFSDLFICNRGVYVLYDFVCQHSYTYGLSMLACILSPIPFAQGIFVNLTGIPSYFLDSANFHTFLEFGAKAPLGLGTNIVGDVYLAFGLIGVIILFQFLGKFIVYIRGKMYDGNYLYTIVYLVIASDAIYMCRGAYLDASKSILWAVFIAWIFIRKRNKYNNE